MDVEHPFSTILEEQLIRRAIDALFERLGPVETHRFLSLPRQQRMESVERHHPVASDMTKRRIL